MKIVSLESKLTMPLKSLSVPDRLPTLSGSWESPNKNHLLSPNDRWSMDFVNDITMNIPGFVSTESGGRKPVFR